MSTQISNPLRGWRKPFNEVTKIVLGVLIALFGEQIVAAAHWRNVTNGTLVDIRRDLALDEAVLEERYLLQVCAARKLAEIKAMLQMAESSHLSPGVSISGIDIPPQPMNRSAWTTAVASGLTLHMGLGERHGLADLDSILAEYDTNQIEENRLWSTLWSLSGPRARISDSLLSIEIAAFNKLLYLNRYNYDVSMYGREKMKELQIMPNYSSVVADSLPKASRGQLVEEITHYAICKPIGKI